MNNFNYDCFECGCDKYWNNYSVYCSTETIFCYAEVTCDSQSKTCTASNGRACLVSYNVSSSDVDYTLKWSSPGFDDITETHTHECSINTPTKTFNQTCN